MTAFRVTEGTVRAGSYTEIGTGQVQCHFLAAASFLTGLESIFAEVTFHIDTHGQRELGASFRGPMMQTKNRGGTENP